MNSILFSLCSILFLLIPYKLNAQVPDNPFENAELQLHKEPGAEGPEYVWSVDFEHGTFTFFGSCDLIETGTYSVSQDSLFFHIVESSNTERENILIAAKWWQLFTGSEFHYITNAKLITMNAAVKDTMELIPIAVSGIEQNKTWKEVKQLFE